MRIKRIEIIGFKSFCDKTVVTIDEPITAIVGPNGCGKSNIVDAIRWCMGEQSAKHLRGKAMEDVIFAGSETRGPAGMAEVSLTFENVGVSHHVTPVVTVDEEEAERAAAEVGLEGEGEGDVDVDAEGAGEVEGVGAAGAAADAGEADAAAEAGAAAALEAAAEAEARAILEDPKPPIDFAEYGEVTITRRLFRDGTSEYFINKTPCRLRDVHDFFLGTGVGTKAYSIIEQGRVGMIVSAKPEDRRLIIEEAAGITKFKKKKQAAERKMEQTRQNLLRVSDIVGEIEKQLGSLRRQAQKAERYKKYRAEVRDIELWTATHRFLGFTVEEQVWRRQLEDVAARRDAAHADHETRDAAIVSERAEAAVEERRLSDLTQVVYDLENRVQLGERQVEFQTREAKELEERAVAATGEIEGLERQLGETRGELDRVREQAAALEARAEEHARELAALEERQRAARGRLDEAQGELDDARGEIARAQADIARGENHQSSLKRRHEDLELRLGRVAEEQGRVEGRQLELADAIGTLDGKLGGLRQLRLDLGHEKEGLERRLAELKELAAQSEAQVETLRTELHRRRSRLQSLREIQDRYEGFARGTRAVMQTFGRAGDGPAEGEAAAQRIRGLVADIVEALPEYEPAVEAVLGDRLGSILVESKQVGMEAIQFLKQRAEGRSSFIPILEFAAPSSGGGAGAGGAGRAGRAGGAGGAIEVVEAEGVRGPILSFVRCRDEYRHIGEYLLGDVLVVESLARALELFDAGVRRPMVTLDGDLLDAHGIVTGGSREAAGAGVLEQKREIRELEEICEGLDRDLADATARHVGTKAELGRVGATLDAIRKDTHQGEITILAHEKDLARWRSEAERLAERRGQLERERAELEAALGETGREAEATRVALDDARRRAADAERRQLGLIEGVTAARGALDEANGLVTECKVQVAQVNAERASVTKQLARLEAQARELDGRIERLRRTIEESGARAAALREDATRLAEELVGVREERRARAEQLAAARQAHEQRTANLQVAEVEARNVRLEAERLGAEATRLEMKLHDLDGARRHLEESIAERYRVELRAHLHDHHLRPPVGPAEEARVKELRELIERMGEINLTAIEEYEELSRRYEFLSTQKRDLENALAQLEKAIAKINRTSRKLFRETFDAVNAKFQEVYPRLFRGGRAELRLTNADEDLLDAGVEIFAQPPGKKNVTVELLSGGEKALTAVSLIFAIFLIKPSPFCLLDEVDAPLDDANVGRYNDLVREMTDRSQFIVITHNKRTMEIADDLYGVTMEEPGCSKLVSVHLRGLERRARAA